MALQQFKNPDNKTGVVELNECNLPKSVSDYESRKIEFQ